MKENIQLTWLDQEISRINPESRIDLGSRVYPENLFNPEIRINLDSRINIRFKSSLRLDQLPRLNWHDQWKTFNWHDQRKFVIKISKWLDPTKMSVESNPGSRINPRTWPDQDISRVNPRSRINPEGRFNPIVESTWRVESIVWFESSLRFDQPSWSHWNEVPAGEFRGSCTIPT